MKKNTSFFNLDVTLEKAEREFDALDPAVMAEKAGADFDSRDQSINLSFINRAYRVESPGGKIFTADGKAAQLYQSILILHYLVTADGTPLDGRWIAYRHLPGGDIYIEPFNNRAIRPFLKTFGNDPEQFRKAAMALGGKQVQMSGIGMTVPVFPRVPICFVIWPGDEEMPPSANILFDGKAASYLPTEDYAHLPAMVTGEMKKQIG